MQLIQVALALVVLGILYARMIGRETPQPIGKAQAVVPVLLGLLSLPLSFVFTFGIGFAFTSAGLTMNVIPIPALRAIASAFFAAGFTEELAKLLLLLVAIAVYKPENVYEYVIAGAGIGFGFTLFEEFVYGGSLASLMRTFTITLHMVFNMIMGTHLGLARHSKMTGDGTAGKHYALAFVVPVLLHTILDACTAFNPALQVAEDNVDLMAGIGLAIALAMLLTGAIGQVVYLLRVKKNAQEYCGIKTR